LLSGWREPPEATAALKNVIAAFEATHPTIDGMLAAVQSAVNATLAGG
jgi:hypothetical protein